MKTFLSDIFPRIQRYSEKLDNLTLLTNQHWVSIDDIISNKTVYIFRSNNELLVSTNGRVEKAEWEYLGNKSLLIEKKTGSYLFKHGFFDENILALKADSSEEYAVFVNENKYDGELNSIDRVFDFLRRTYLDSSIISNIESKTGQIITSAHPKLKTTDEFETDKGKIIVELNFEGANPAMYNKVYQNHTPAKDGKYKLGFMNYLVIKDGIIFDFTVF
jgi:hypothetical protein